MTYSPLTTSPAIASPPNRLETSPGSAERRTHVAALTPAYASPNLKSKYRTTFDISNAESTCDERSNCGNH
jgi:hypothetical protein